MKASADANGDLTNAGNIYWDEMYATQSALEELQAGRTVEFRKG